MHNACICVYGAYMYMHLCVVLVLCGCACMIVHVYICLPFACFDLHVLALHTAACMKRLTVSSLQLSAVVLPPKLLQMVKEVALVQLLSPQ